MKTSLSPDIKVKIVSFLDAALKKQIPWIVLENFIDELTPNLEMSKQVIKILMRIIRENDESNIGHPIKMNILNNEDHTSYVNEENESESAFIKIDSEQEEVFDENDVSKNIKLVEAFKGQFYTFVGDTSEEKSDEDSCYQSLELDKVSGKMGNDEVSISEEKMLNQKTFECQTCGKCFKVKSSLKRHVRLHTGEKPFKCKDCSKCFAQLTSLIYHKKTHTGEKPFVCNTCNKGFAQSGDLKRHTMFHSGEKPYICKTCKKGFFQSCDLKKHERTHTGEKPYKCKACDKAFVVLSSLRDHEIFHTGEQPYQCKMCNKTFSNKRNCNRHENKSHKKDE